MAQSAPAFVSAIQLPAGPVLRPTQLDTRRINFARGHASLENRLARGLQGVALGTATALVGLVASKQQRKSARRAAGSGERQLPVSVSRSNVLRGLACSVPSLPVMTAPLPAVALNSKEANEELVSLGAPDLTWKGDPSFGWAIQVEPYALAKNAGYGKFNLGKEPMVVTFQHPALWVVSRPNIDENGTAGTVAVNDFTKGDSATLWVDTQFQGKLEDMTRKDFLNEMRKALTQKGGQFIEALKITAVKDGPAPGYRLCEYDYEIESGAGFQLNRTGWASFAQAGEDGNLQVFWSASLTPRYGNMEKTLLEIVNSFRIAKIPKSVSKTLTKDIKSFEDFLTESAA
mmetsp:Transcript_11917/g.21813  ORF Transcript_11917/g.21813 Transcript_11917/m.21813 type:complete len:345 (+) Transcript_11917:99-1133(+)